jgi:hypothetical protein
MRFDITAKSILKSCIPIVVDIFISISSIVEILENDIVIIRVSGKNIEKWDYEMIIKVCKLISGILTFLISNIATIILKKYVNYDEDDENTIVLFKISS